MDDRIRTGRIGGPLLVVGGVGFSLAGVLHPQPIGATQYHEAMLAMLSNPRWPAAHWTALVTGIVVTWAVWLLVDGGWVRGSIAALAGARLAILATLFMCVEWAAEIAARGGLEAYAQGQVVPMASLVEATQGVGWPAFGLGFALLAVCIPASAPRWVAILGAVGAVMIGLGGLLAGAFQLPQAGALFLGGHLLALWMVWAGVRATRAGSMDGAAFPRAAAEVEVGVTS